MIDDRPRHEAQTENTIETRRVQGAVHVLALINVILKRSGLILVLTVSSGLLMAAMSLLLPIRYEAVATFVPEGNPTSGALPGGLAGLATQLGVGIPAGAQSPDFYAQLLKSRTILDRILLTTFPNPSDLPNSDSQPLLNILEIEGNSLRARLERGRRKLSDLTIVRVDNRTRIVSVSSIMPDPKLAAGVANKFVDEVNRFNLENRQSGAKERRRFRGERLAEIERELQLAEDELTDFFEANREFVDSPELMARSERLRRRVALKAELFSTLRRAHEQARIDEVNDIPVITVIDQAIPPKDRTSPKRKRLVLLVMFAAAVAGVFLAFMSEYFTHARQAREADFLEFTSHLKRLRLPFARLVKR